MENKNDNRDYREIDEEINAVENFIITGYAVTYKPYKLDTIDGIDYYEQIEKEAFNETDMSDVILQYNHEGKVFARQKNNTLILEVDDLGLKVTADLSKTNASKEMYEDIKTGMIDKMSWAFIVEDEYFNEETNTRHITKVKKIYDVSVVSIPANEDTTIKTKISARTFIGGVINKKKTDRLERRQLEYEYLYKRAIAQEGKNYED